MERDRHFSALENFRVVKYIKKIIANKYLLAITAFTVWMLFFDRNDLPLQVSRMQELNKLERSEKVLNDKISETTTELESLKNNPRMLEKYAREKYLMKKSNEDLFLVETVSGK